MTIPEDGSTTAGKGDGHVPSSGSHVETQIADRVFKVTDNFYRLSIPTGFKIGDANVWLADGDAPILFDTGTGSPEAVQTLETALCHIGRGIKDIRTVLLTHAHIDHFGGAYAINKIASCPVHIHRSDLARVRNFMETSRVELNRFYPVMLQMGFSEESIQRGAAGLQALRGSVFSCPTASELPESIDSSFGPITWHHVPGHSKGDVVFMIESARLAVTGDHVLTNVTSSPSLSADDGANYPAAFHRYREGLAWSSQLTGYLGCPGHGTPFRSMKKRVSEIFAAQTARYEKAKKVVAELGPATMLQITTGLFGKRNSFEVLMLATETAGYVSMMETAGLCRVEHATDGRPDIVVPLHKST